MISKTIKAQSILEYVIVLTVIVGGILAASSYLDSKVQSGMRGASDSMLASLSGNPSISTPATPTTPTNPADPTIPSALSTQLFSLLGIPNLSRPATSDPTFKYNTLATEYEVTWITPNTVELQEKYALYRASHFADPSFTSDYAAYQATLNDLQDHGYITLIDRRFEKK
jgi:hypothetical protein